jgi:putative spermidine/putrescine transport system permease protein
VKYFNNKQWTIWSKPYLMILPSAALMVILVGYGLLMAGVESVHTPQGEWTLAYYHQLFADQAVWDSMKVSIKVTLTATVVSLVVGLFLTRLLYQYLHKNHWKVFVWIPMLIPHFVAGYLVIFFLAPSGWLSALFFQLGWIDDRLDFPIFVMDRHGIGIILTYIWKEVPFVVLMLLPVYYQLDHRYADVVRTLGGSAWQVFRATEWPWLAPVVLEVTLILFSFILAAYEVPYLLGVTYPQMLSIISYDWYYSGDWSKRPLAMATMVIISLLIGFICWIGFILTRRLRYIMMKGR